MPASSDILVIGGGVAGLSAAAALSRHGRVTVLEAEEAIGVHSSGRSATMLHYALGDALVRALTLASRSFFDAPPHSIDDAPLGRPIGVLVHARAGELAELDALDAAIAPFVTLERVGEDRIAELCPLLRRGEGGAVAALLDADGIRIDPHALLQAYLRQLRGQGGSLVTDARLASVAREGGAWVVRTERGERFAAPVLVNAAGAWADSVAVLAGVEPLGLVPMRRTIIVVDAPPGTDVARLPFTKTVGDELYFGPESGRIFASPMDETAIDPCDAQPDDYDAALAAWRLEERTVVKVERIAHRWAGLRTFAPDRRPVAGFDPRADGFFWLAGQGGAGLQTSPAMAAIVECLVAGTDWPVEAVSAGDLAPGRFLGQAA